MAVNAVIVLIFLSEKEHCFTQLFAVEHDWSVKVVCTVPLELEWGWVFSDIYHAFNTWQKHHVIHYTENLDIGPQGNVPCIGDSFNTQILYFAFIHFCHVCYLDLLSGFPVAKYDNMTISIFVPVYCGWPHTFELHYHTSNSLELPRLVHRKIIFCYSD